MVIRLTVGVVVQPANNLRGGKVRVAVQQGEDFSSSKNGDLFIARELDKTGVQRREDALIKLYRFSAFGSLRWRERCPIRNLRALPQVMEAEILDRRVAGQKTDLGKPHFFSKQPHVISREVV